jgi:hypothetical protein
MRADAEVAVDGRVPPRCDEGDKVDPLCIGVAAEFAQGVDERAVGALEEAHLMVRVRRDRVVHSADARQSVIERLREKRGVRVGAHETRGPVERAPVTEGSNGSVSRLVSRGQEASEATEPIDERDDVGVGVLRTHRVKGRRADAGRQRFEVYEERVVWSGVKKRGHAPDGDGLRAGSDVLAVAARRAVAGCVCCHRVPTDTDAIAEALSHVDSGGVSCVVHCCKVSTLRGLGSGWHKEAASDEQGRDVTKPFL